MAFHRKRFKFFPAVSKKKLDEQESAPLPNRIRPLCLFFAQKCGLYRRPACSGGDAQSKPTSGCPPLGCVTGTG